MGFAVCIKCGAIKSYSIQKCKTCHFRPEEEEDKAKSLILSDDYEIDNEYLGKDIEELKKIASAIQSGADYKFSEQEVQDIIAYAHKVMNIPKEQLFFGLIKWLGPVVLWFLFLLAIRYLATH